jgi:hypothetical protein
MEQGGQEVVQGRAKEEGLREVPPGLGRKEEAPPLAVAICRRFWPLGVPASTITADNLRTKASGYKNGPTKTGHNRNKRPNM